MNKPSNKYFEGNGFFGEIKAIIYLVNTIQGYISPIILVNTNTFASS